MRRAIGRYIVALLSALLDPEHATMHYTLNPMTEHQTGAEIVGLDLKVPLLAAA